jgi:colanic acid/amylovoran biosynthesis glycosyltransferase
MQKIAYLLHRFPGITDTFIKREIVSLKRAGANVRVISVWKPIKGETTAQILEEWSADTSFLLPRSYLSTVALMIGALVRYPIRFLGTLRLALSTAKPGLRGFVYQLFYFIEAMLAAEEVRRCEIAHLHNHIGDQSGTVTMLAANFAKIGYSISFHGWPVFFDAQGSHLKEKVLRAQFSRAISYFCRSQLMMFSGCNEVAKYRVIHCGLDLKKYSFRLPKKEVKQLFCAARLSPEKGLDFLIRCLKLLRDRGFSLRLRLAGDGSQRAELQRLASELNVSEFVEFLGFLNEDEIIRELEASDLFVLPSFVEGVPVCVMEAMAIGVPVIATNIAGTSELVTHGVTGLLVRPSDSEALADAAVEMITNYEFRLRAAELGRKVVVENFDVELETAKLNASLAHSVDSLRVGRSASQAD